MPHAKTSNTAIRSNGVNGNHKMGSAPVTNGDGPHSAFLSHLTSYPLVSDSISTYKSNPYGAKTLNIFTQLYSTVDANIYKPISPYLQGPYSIVAPYIAKADSLGDAGLSNLESRFPIVKEDTSKLKERAQQTAGYPFAVANDGKDKVFKIYGEEVNKYEKRGYGPVLKHTRALVDTDLRVIIAVLQAGTQWLTQAQKTAEAKVEKKKSEFKKENGTTN